MPRSEPWGLAMRRRDFVKGIAGSAIGWPLAARAQQSDRVRRIGLLMLVAETDSQARAERTAFTKELGRLGWIGGKKYSDRSALG